MAKPVNKFDGGYERESRMTPIFFGVNEWCPLMKWRLGEKKQELYFRDVETIGYKNLESKGEVTWGVTSR